MTELTPATDTTAADWIVDALRTFAESVNSLVPAGFPAYVRVFHPPRERETKRPIRWSAVAEANGMVAHPGMQWTSIMPGSGGSRDSYGPRVGSMPPEVGPPLVSVLARHTTTPGRCWFAIWNGFGSAPAHVEAAPTFRVPGRDYFLFEGPIDGAVEGVPDYGLDQTPNIWWPEDHAWCVATEIDLDTTYVGCSEACRDELLTTAELEASAIDPATGISFASDTVNPPPPWAT